MTENEPKTSGTTGKKIGIAIVVVVALLLLGFFTMKSKKGSEESMINSGTTPPPASNVKSGTEQQSLKGLLGMGASNKQVCTFRQDSGSYSSEGTVYVADGKMRGDFTNNLSGKVSGSHMFTDGTTNYIWTDDQQVGYKMSFTANPSGSSTNTESMDVNKNYDFNCKNWNGDQSKFEVPAEIKFQDLSSMMQGSTQPSGSGQAGSSTDSTAQMKAACNSLQEPSKTQCLSAIK